MSLTWSLQALLVRHEAYVAEAEEDRKHLRCEIERLTTGKDALQLENNNIIENNKRLLQSLEKANASLDESDIHVRSLTTTLQTAQEEIQRLNILASRTDLLERELERFELEQTRLHTCLALKTEQEKVATVRWQASERNFAALEDRVKAVEEESRAERQAHAEILDRLQQHRLLEREIDTTGGRSKAATAGKSSNGSPVVSHFVKDLLQDNANLRLSISELRDMLLIANEDLERLQTQVMEHDRLSTTDQTMALQTYNSLSTSLSHEVERPNTREVHVHHHYHGSGPKTREPNRRHSQITARRPKKRLTVTPFGSFGQRSVQAVELSINIPTSLPTPPPSEKATPHSDDSANIPSYRPISSQRWSMHSAMERSTMPSSPPISFQSPSVFDHLYDQHVNSSRPTTPGIELHDSPLMTADGMISSDIDLPHHEDCEKLTYDDELDTLKYVHGRVDEKKESQEDDVSDHLGIKPACNDNADQNETSYEDEEDEDDQDAPVHSLVDFRLPVPNLPPVLVNVSRRASLSEDQNQGHRGSSMPRLRQRSNSHESLISVSGMDIHTLKSRPSQMLTGLSIRAPSSRPLLSQPTVQTFRADVLTKPGHNLLSSIATERSGGHLLAQTDGQGLGTRMSGWMFGKWSNSKKVDGKFDGDSTAERLNKERSVDIAKGNSKEVRAQIKIRPPGINQPGAILGFLADQTLPRARATTRLTTTTTSREPIMQVLDPVGLKQSLCEV